MAISTLEEEYASVSSPISSSIAVMGVSKQGASMMKLVHVMHGLDEEARTWNCLMVPVTTTMAEADPMTVETSQSNTQKGAKNSDDDLQKPM
ncbi:hypothetical protein MRX96_009800 [Rhipicephalus microplus]